jgi:hypothetical protein
MCEAVPLCSYWRRNRRGNGNQPPPLAARIHLPHGAPCARSITPDDLRRPRVPSKVGYGSDSFLRQWRVARTLHPNERTLPAAIRSLERAISGPTACPRRQVRMAPRKAGWPRNLFLGQSLPASNGAALPRGQSLGWPSLRVPASLEPALPMRGQTSVDAWPYTSRSSPNNHFSTYKRIRGSKRY